MCGIAGVSCKEPSCVNLVNAAVSRMVDAMHHRGPDDQGQNVVSNGPDYVVLGNTRLAILDLSHNGHQPFHDPDSGNWCVLNGEIYNHLEIRAALGDLRWRSTCDTETVLRAYGVWGGACVERLRGMFAIAIYDARRRTLWCTRDHLGIKPFYYYAGSSQFTFASEVKVLLQSGLVPRELDHEGLAGYMRFGSVVEPKTLVRGVCSLPPGHWMEVAHGAITAQGQYWSLTQAALGCTPAANGTIFDLLQSSVREQLVADVPVACFLSGGVDSSAITACAALASHAPLHTFTVALRGTEMDESSEARAVSDRFETEHIEVRLSDSEVAAHVPLAVASMDLPSMDGVNTFVVSRAVRASGIKVALSGLGGDELFGGYRSFRLLPFAMQWGNLLGRLPRGLSGLLPGGERGIELMRPGASLAGRYSTLRSFWPQSELSAMGLPAALPIADPDPSLPLNTRVSILELDLYMRSVLLRDSDAMSMACSVELRVPFLDHRLVGYALRNHLAGRGKKDKLIAAFNATLHRHTLHRGKQGFELPMATWLRGVLSSFCREGLSELDREAVLSVPTAEYAGRFAAGQLAWGRLWQLAVLGHWLKRLREHPAPAVPE